MAAFTDRPLCDSLTVLYYIVYARQRKAMTASRTFRYGKEVYYIIYSIESRGNTSAECHGGLYPARRACSGRRKKAPCFAQKRIMEGETVENLCNGELPLALPLGELSPQATERARQISKPPGLLWHGHCLPSPSSLRSATSPTGRGKAVKNSRQYRFPPQRGSLRGASPAWVR